MRLPQGWEKSWGSLRPANICSKSNDVTKKINFFYLY